MQTHGIYNGANCLKLYHFNSTVSDYETTTKISADGYTYDILKNISENAPQDEFNDYPKYYALVKEIDESGNRRLRYQRLLLKFNSDINLTTIQNITQQINELEGEVDDIYNQMSQLSGVVEDLSSSPLSGEYWELGKDATKCYGKAIGDSQKNEVINLDNKGLYGDWVVDGSVSLTGNFYQAGEYTYVHSGGIYLDAGYVGGLAGDNSITLVAPNNINIESNKNISITSKTGNLALQNNDILIEDDNITLLASNIEMIGNVKMPSDGTLTIGNTTLTESDLQRLLALLN